MKILVGVDLSEHTEKVIKKAEEIASTLSAKLWLLHVADLEPDFIGYDTGPQSVRDSVSQDFHKEHQQIQDIAKQLRTVGLDTTALLVQGVIVDTILNEASKLEVDMIILGSHGRGVMYQLLVGSVCEGVLKKSEYPILVIPTHERT